MAYGTIKAEKLAFTNNAGAEEEVSLSSWKADPTFTGTINGANLTLSGDLQVNGTTTTINSTTLTVDDKNIELGSVASPDDTTADGGGITLKGASDKTILWTNSTDSWDFNQDIKTSGIVSDSKGDVRTIPKVTKTDAYTPTDRSDVGKVIELLTSETNGVTINTSVYAAGDAITIVNNVGSARPITQGTSLTMYNSADASTGNRTLGARGVATIWFSAHDTCFISGAGLS